MKHTIEGRAIRYGNDISTDLIIAGKYTKTTNLNELAMHAMEDLDPCFQQKVQAGGILVAGEYFGCGSSREQAPVALREAQVRCVIAKSFARIFYRNAVNVGLPIIECDTDRISDNDELEYTFGDDMLKNMTTGEDITVRPLPEMMLRIFCAGGLTQYIKENRGFEDIQETPRKEKVIR